MRVTHKSQGQSTDQPLMRTLRTKAAAKRAARPTVWRSERGSGRPQADNSVWKKRSF
jgi:hypothetical protein